VAPKVAFHDACLRLFGRRHVPAVVRKSHDPKKFAARLLGTGFRATGGPALGDVASVLDQIAERRERPAGRVRLVVSRLAAAMVLAPKRRRVRRCLSRHRARCHDHKRDAPRSG